MNDRLEVDHTMKQGLLYQRNIFINILDFNQQVGLTLSDNL